MTVSVAERPSLSARTDLRIRAALAGHGAGRLSAVWLFAGPAVVASIAYMDPGNYATNIQAGARYGYGLLWVALLANAIAMLFQALSARLGIVTGHNLAELCRRHFPRRLVLTMWAVSEIAAMATDLAEFIGGAIGVSLLSGLPLLAAMAIVGVVTYAILLLEGRGFRPMELVIGGLIGVIAACYVVELIIVPPAWGAVLVHTVLPQLPDANAATLAVGIVGATVMPHAIYLHSGLTQARTVVDNEHQRRRLLRFSTRECIVALSIAGLINLAMIVTASGAFHAGHRDVAELGTAYVTLVPLLGAGAAGIFLASLIASGVSSSVVGTMAGQIIMQGFVGFRLPVWLRRLVTMLPAFFVVACGVDATQALVLSQVVLSFALPVPMIALLLLTRRRDVMGAYVNSKLVDIVATGATAIVLLLNTVLLLQTLGVRLAV